MVELYTSHWRSPLLADVDATPASISRGEPRFPVPFQYKRLRALAPNNATWVHEDLGEFERAYVDQLEALGVERILGDLWRVGGGRPCVLLCWERLSAADEYCHRVTLRRFLRERAGVEIEELEPGMLPRREDAVGMRLF